MSEDRLYAVRLLWVRDPDLFAQYQEMTKPILARHGVHIERWLMTDAIEGEGMEKPDEVVVTWFTSSDARNRSGVRGGCRDQGQSCETGNSYGQVRVRRLISAMCGS